MTAFLDELARSMAKPMPRRRALRVVGGAVVAIAVPGLVTTKARATSSFHLCKKKGGLLCECNCKGDICQRICCTPAEKYECYCGSVQYGAACKKKCDVPCPSDVHCCQEDEFCANSAQKLCCKKGESGCGPRCCAVNEECTTIRVGTGSERLCEKRCPQGQAWCDQKKCCPRGWSCVLVPTGWQCRRCRPDQVQCGTKCCNKGTTCCEGKMCCDKKTSRCCGKAGCCPEGRDCCNTGGTQTCCPAGQKCAVPTVGNAIGPPGTKAICCPPARYNKNPKLCCPPGMVALNSPSFRIPPPGVPPDCCPPSMVCRSGATAYCANLQSDPENCGSCGTRCASRYCSSGVCVFP